MLSDAVSAMLTRLRVFLPMTGPPPPSLSLVSAAEELVGLGGSRGLGTQDNFPVALRGVRVRSTVRFQVWDTQPDAVEGEVAAMVGQVLAQKDALVVDGFLDLKLSGTSPTGFEAAVPAWRQSAEFDVLYEFQSQDTDGSGGLIARIPAEFRDAFGAEVLSGDITIWNESGAQARLLEGIAAFEGFASLGFLPGALPASPVTVTRTFQGAAGAPVSFATLADFLAATDGASPANRHATVTLPTLSDFLTALGPVSNISVVTDKGPVPRPPVPPTGLCTPTPPGNDPSGEQCDYCPSCSGDHGTTSPSMVLTPTGRIAVQVHCVNCGSVMVRPATQLVAQLPRMPAAVVRPIPTRRQPAIRSRPGNGSSLHAAEAPVPQKQIPAPAPHDRAAEEGSKPQQKAGDVRKRKQPPQPES
jgi:hypothetical protein